MKFKILLATVLLAASSTAVMAGDDLASVLKQAVAENDKAKAVGFEWRDTAKIIEKAKEEKDAAKAIKLAKKALKQAQLAQKQAEVAKDAGPRF